MDGHATPTVNVTITAHATKQNKTIGSVAGHASARPKRTSSLWRGRAAFPHVSPPKTIDAVLCLRQADRLAGPKASCSFVCCRRPRCSPAGVGLSCTLRAAKRRDAVWERDEGKGNETKENSLSPSSPATPCMVGHALSRANWLKAIASRVWHFPPPSFFFILRGKQYFHYTYLEYQVVVLTNVLLQDFR